MTKNAIYKTNFEIQLPIKLKEKVSIDFSFLDCKEFKLEKKNEDSKWNEYKGHITVELDKPDMDLANKRVRLILSRILQLLTIEKKASKEALSFDTPILLNPEDLKGVEKTGYKDVRCVVDIAIGMKEEEFLSIRDILEKIEKISSRRLIYSIMKVYDEYLITDYKDKVEEGWKVIDLFIIQSRKTDISDKGPIKLVNEFVNDHINQQESSRIVTKYKTYITDLSNFTIVNRDGKDRTQDLKQELLTNHQKKILMHSLHCIYEVRNLKLHRDATHPAYKSAEKLLDVLLKEFWEIRLKEDFKQK